MPVKGLNILFITAHFPYPLIGGERIKQSYLINHLAKNNKVFLVSLDKGYEIKDEYIQELKKNNIEAYGFRINKFKSYFNAAIYSPFGHPMEIEYFRHKLFNQKIKEIVANNKIDLVLNFFLRTAEYAKNINTKKILIAEDCRSYYQSRTSKVTANLREKAIRYYESVKLKKYESEIVNYFDLTTLVSDIDMEQMKLLNNKADIRILTNGVNTDIFSPPEKQNQRKDLLFLGKLDFLVNTMMVKRIIKEIYPLILKTNPDVKLHIVGANPTKELQKFASSQINFHSNVEKIAPFYQQAAAFIHPHEGGSGIQNKVLEAMSCSCPVITTSSGAGGIGIINRENGFIAGSNDEFAAIACELLNNEKLCNSIGENARKYILENHNWNNINQEFDRMIEEILN
jgi:glycosyltransferase involved in cell wall biosynthesis